MESVPATAGVMTSSMPATARRIPPNDLATAAIIECAPPCMSRFPAFGSPPVYRLETATRSATSAPAAPRPQAQMTSPAITPREIRNLLLLREEIALLDLRHEAQFATGHPLFAANMAAGRIALEAETRLPRKDVPVVLYDNGEGLVPGARETFARLGYTNVRELAGGLQAWAAAGYELFQDVN